MAEASEESTDDKRRDRKRTQSQYPFKQVKRKKKISELSIGMKGILITTNDKEKLCVNEAYKLLNEYADKLYGPEIEEKISSDNEDIEEQLTLEINAIKSKERKRRFQAVLSGAKNVVFIQCDGSIDPCNLVHHMLCDIMDNKTIKTRFCLRIIPVTAVCRATINDIKKCANDVLFPHFHGDDPTPLEFAVHYKARNNHVMKRDDVIRLLASLVTDEGAYDHVVNLKQPQLVVCAEIIRNICCLSVLKDFYSLKQYNVQSINETFLTSETTATEPIPDSTRKEEEGQTGTSFQETTQPHDDKTVDLTLPFLSGDDIDQEKIVEETPSTGVIEDKETPQKTKPVES